MSTEERTTSRSQSYAKLLLDNKQPAYMRDISPRGFRIYSPVPLTYKEGESLPCRIIPTDESESSFTIRGIIRWSRQTDEGDGSVGMEILSFATEEGKELFDRMCRLFS